MVMELRKRKVPVQASASEGTASKSESTDKPPTVTPTITTAKRQRRTTRKASRNSKSNSELSSAEMAGAASDRAGTSAATVPVPISVPKVGEKINLDDFGGTVKRNDGKEVTLKTLVNECDKGVVIFTYPRASTPGCTTQACLFRDSYSEITDAGFAVYGLSADSPNANTNFQTKQKLPYPLLCDTEQILIGALGLKKTPKGTIRGVFMIDKKTSEVLLLQPGSPSGTMDETKKVIASRKEESSKL
ncbi:hypothetical protein KEM54_006391 [Ascosphaera aggregata]|nr:hypothetical protein KEM54_006391 [Ascosphaera aggregata]